MVDPGTAMLIAAAVAAAAKGAGDFFSNSSAKKSASRRAKEQKRETEAGLANETMNRSADLEAQRLAGRKKIGKRKAQSSQETSDLVRGALNI